MTLATRREFLSRALATTVVASAWRPAGAITAGLPAREIEELYERAVTGDALVYSEDYASTLDAAALRGIRSSGMTYAFYDVSITPSGRSFADCIRSVTLWNEAVVRNRDTVLRAGCAADILRAKREGRHAMVYLFQDAAPLDRDLSRLRLFYDLGVRVIQLTHNSRNLVGDGYTDRVNGGLSDFGVDLVAAMNDARVLVDLSHCGERTTFEAVEFSRLPCAFTHTGCRALLPSERNKTDVELRALAAKGGVIGIFNMSCWLTESETPSVDQVLDHIHHAVKVAGIEHVGVGSDGPMTGVQRLGDELAGHVQFSQLRTARRVYLRRPTHVRVTELNQPKRLLVLADALSRRGYRAADIEKIIGGNFLRLFREVVG